MIVINTDRSLRIKVDDGCYLSRAYKPYRNKPKGDPTYYAMYDNKKLTKQIIWRSAIKERASGS